MGAAKEALRVSSTRCRKSMFVSKLRDVGYTGAACLPPLGTNLVCDFLHVYTLIHFFSEQLMSKSFSLRDF